MAALRSELAKAEAEAEVVAAALGMPWSGDPNETSVRTPAVKSDDRKAFAPGATGAFPGGPGRCLHCHRGRK